MLRRCYKNSVDLARSNQLKSIAFPNISTGIYGFPKDLAAQIAYNEIKACINKYEELEVTFVCYDEENYKLYQELMYS